MPFTSRKVNVTDLDLSERSRLLFNHIRALMCFLVFIHPVPNCFSLQRRSCFSFVCFSLLSDLFYNFLVYFPGKVSVEFLPQYHWVRERAHTGAGRGQSAGGSERKRSGLEETVGKLPAAELTGLCRARLNYPAESRWRLIDWWRAPGVLRCPAQEVGQSSPWTGACGAEGWGGEKAQQASLGRKQTKCITDHNVGLHVCVRDVAGGPSWSSRGAVFSTSLSPPCLSSPVTGRGLMNPGLCASMDVHGDSDFTWQIALVWITDHQPSAGPLMTYYWKRTWTKFQFLV